MLSSAIMMTDRNMRLLPLALRSVNPCLELTTVFIFKYFINPSMEYLISIWWHFVSKIVQKHCGTRFSLYSSHRKTVSSSVCLSEGAPITKGAGLTERSIDILEMCGLLVDHFDVFISCLDSHSDGTHSLQRIHWWAGDVMLNFFYLLW